MNTRLSGLIPQLSVIMGPCAGGAVYSPALTDFVFMLRRTAYMFVTGPDVVQAVTHESMTREELGGSDVHCQVSGVSHGAFDGELEALERVRTLLRFLPQNNTDTCPLLLEHSVAVDDGPVQWLNNAVPWESTRSYDMRDILKCILDCRDFFELQSEYAKNIVIGFGRLAGHTVGLVANQPATSSGVLDIDASCKAARFVRFCGAFAIPILTFVDVPGFLPGRTQEHGGIIRHGAKLLHAYAEADGSPRLTVIVRKAYGGAYDVMSSRHLGADRVYAWPTAEIAVMGSAGATRILGESQGAEEAKMGGGSGVLGAALRGHIDAVLIDPSSTRSRLIRDLEGLRSVKDGKGSLSSSSSPWKRHGNIPL